MTLRRRLLPTLLLAALACERDPVRPPAPEIVPTFAESNDNGPPPSYPFGPDTRETGVFTGQEVPGQPRLVCAEGGTRFEGYFESHVDRTLLDATLELPGSAGPYPMVVLLHGWAGSKRGSGDEAARLLGNGYAVLRYSARGFGDSWGRVNLADIGVEIGDLRSVITRVVEQPACAVDGSRVALTGASYGGGQSWLAAAEPVFQVTPSSPEITIRTIVPLVPWTDLLYSLIPNGRPRYSIGVAGTLKWSYVQALYSSGQRAPGEGPEPWYDNYPAYLRAWHASLTTLEPIANPLYPQIRDGLAGYRSIWWQERFWDGVRAGNRLPIFQVQGFTDDLFTLDEAKRMLLALRTIDPSYPIASYFGDIGHPRARNNPAEVEYVFDLIDAWLAHYLKGEGAAPPNVIYASVTAPAGGSFNPSDVIVVQNWDDLATDEVEHTFRRPSVLVNPASGAPSGPGADPVLEAGIEAAGELKPLTGQIPQSAAPDPTAANYWIPVALLTRGSDLLIAGQPSVTLTAFMTSPRVQLNVRVWDVSLRGTKELITRGTFTTGDDVVGRPGAPVEVTISTAGNLWRVPRNHLLQIEITNNDFPYLAPSQVPSATTILRVELRVPRRS